MDTPVSRRAVHIVLAYALTVVDVGVTLCVIWGWLLGRSLRYLATLFAVLLSKVIVTAYYARVCTIQSLPLHALIINYMRHPRARIGTPSRLKRFTPWWKPPSKGRETYCLSIRTPLLKHFVSHLGLPLSRGLFAQLASPWCSPTGTKISCAALQLLHRPLHPERAMKRAIFHHAGTDVLERRCLTFLSWRRCYTIKLLNRTSSLRFGQLRLQIFLPEILLGPWSMMSVTLARSATNHLASDLVCLPS